MKRVLWCLLAACGGSSDSPPTPDTMPEPQPGGPVTIEITLDGAPQGNVEVVFQNSDSSVINIALTDAEGRAAGNLSEDGFVTVVEPRPQAASRDRLSTFAGVQPGDVLHLDLRAPVPQPGTDHTFELRFDLDAGRTSHLVRTSCGNPQRTGNEANPNEFSLRCDDVADFLVISESDEGGDFRSHFTEGEALDAIVDLTGKTYDPFVTANIEYRNLPAGMGFLGVYRAFKTSRGLVFEDSSGAFADGADPTKAVTTLGMPMTAGSTLLTSSTTHPQTTGCDLDNDPPVNCPGGRTCDNVLKVCETDVGQQTIVEWKPFSTDDYSLDLAVTQLPAFATAPAFDPATRSISWTEAAIGQEPNFVRVTLAVFRDDIPQGRGWDWRLVAPRSGTELSYPVLPLDRDGFDFNVIEGDTSTVTTLTTALLPAGYLDKAVRERAFEDVDGQIAGDTGLVIIQDLFEPIL